MPLLIGAAVLLGLALAARAGMRRLPGERAGDPSEMEAGTAAGRVTILLLWLLVVAAVALASNPFGAVTFLALPAVLWIWVMPGPTLAPRAATTLLVLAGFLVVGLLFAQYAATLRIGGYIFWHVFLALAYTQFTPLQIVLTCATLAVGIRLIAVGTVGRTRPA